MNWFASKPSRFSPAANGTRIALTDSAVANEVADEMAIANGLRKEITMKNLTNRVVLVLVVALCALAAQAQSSVMLKGTVPMNFMIGDHSLTAGDYTVRAFTKDVEGWYDQDGRGLFLITTVPMGKEADAATYKLVFHRYGETYFLTEVWSGGVSHKVAAGSAQRQIAKVQKPSVVAVLLTR